MTPKKILLIALAIGSIPSISFASCGAAFCTVNSNWTSESASLDPGASFELRYEYIKQNQPRTGTDNLAVGQIHKHHDEVSTINKNLVATYSQTFASGWGFSVVAPIANRKHMHIHNHRRFQSRWRGCGA